MGTGCPGSADAASGAPTVNLCPSIMVGEIASTVPRLRLRGEAVLGGLRDTHRLQPVQAADRDRRTREERPRPAPKLLNQRFDQSPLPAPQAISDLIGQEPKAPHLRSRARCPSAVDQEKGRLAEPDESLGSVNLQPVAVTAPFGPGRPQG